MNITESSSPSLVKTIFKNALFITLGSMSLRVINFLFRVYVVRSLGDERFGRYSAVLAFVGLFQIFAELGMTQYFMREVSRDRTKAHDYFWNLVVLRALLAFTAVFGITYAARLAGYSPELRLGVMLFTVTFLLSAVDAPLEALLIANERFDYVTAKNVLNQIIFVVLGGLFMYADLGYIWLIIAGIIAQLPQIGFGAWAVHRHHLLPRPLFIAPRRWFYLIRSGMPFGIIALTLSIAFSIDSVMLKMFHTDQIVGWYGAAYGLIFTMTSFMSGFKDAMVPSLSRVYVHDPLQVEQWYFRTVKVIILISLPIAIGGVVIAYPLIRFLYTEEFLPSALALQILVWDIPFLMFAAFCGNMTTIIKFEKSAARIYTLNAALNVILNLLFIPRYGIIAASIVTVVTDIFSALQFYLLLHRQLKLPNLSSVLMRTLLAAGTMGVVVGLLGRQHLFVIIPIGVVVYFALALLLRLLDEDEWNFIRRVSKKLRVRFL